MTELPLCPSIVQWWVALPSFLISSPFLTIISSQNAAFRCTWHFESYYMLWVLKSLARTVPTCHMTCNHIICLPDLSPDCGDLYLLTLTSLIMISPLLLSSVAITLSLPTVCKSVRSSTTRLLHPHITVEHCYFFIFRILSGWFQYHRVLLEHLASTLPLPCVRLLSPVQQWSCGMTWHCCLGSLN